MSKFSPLFKKSSTGKLLTWDIAVSGNVITTTHGQVGGKLQVDQEEIREGKNVGRANETSPEQQATAEAKSRWEKKQKAGAYVLTQEVALAGGSSELVEGGLLPMLAHRFDEQGDKLVYPCFVQPKLDGHRCTGMPDGSLWSRTRKAITGVPHIGKAVADLDMLLPGPFPLDGELYQHDYRDRFEELTSFIRQKTPKSGYEVVQYHVYDVHMPHKFFSERIRYLEALVGGLRAGPIKLVETRLVESEDELLLAFEDFLAQGYEGAIARNAEGFYVNKRSYDLLKIKQFLDREFMCTGVEEGRGKMAGHAIFRCEDIEGLPFMAKMKGSMAELKQYFDNPRLVIGKQITVKYQGLSKYGIPRFPVALRIRNDL